MIDPLHQFEIIPLVPLELWGYDISLTNSAAWMLVATFSILVGLWIGSREKRLVPTSWQFICEKLYTFIAEMIDDQTHGKGRVFFPYVFSLFVFILMGNLLGLLPFSFTFTSHIIVTFALALAVFITVTFYGFYRHGTKFFGLFCPEGTPLFIAPLIIPVEIISYLSRPISLSIRLFANMVAGHAMLKIFMGFVVILGTGVFMPLSALPFVVNILIMFFEVLVSLLQAYVFTILTCIYLNDAVNLH